MSIPFLGKKGYQWVIRNLFITLIFALLYYISDEITMKNKDISKRFGTTSLKRPVEYLYFSLVTQSTLGATILNSSVTGPDNTFKANLLTRYINMVQLMGIIIIGAMELD